MKSFQIFLFVVALFAFFSRIHGFSQSNQEIDEMKLQEQTIQLLRPHTAVIRKWFWELADGHVPWNIILKDVTPKADFITCDVCTIALPLLRLAMGFNVPDEIIIKVISTACEVLDLAPKPEVCEPTIRSYAAPIMYIVKHQPDLSNSDFCGVINPGCNGVALSPHLTNWEVAVDINKPQVVLRPPVPSNSGSVKIIHLTDIHLDLDYKIGTDASCGLPICCREGKPVAGSAPAGKFGHFSCELPELGLQTLYDHAKQINPDAGLVFLTGDYIHSGVWLYSPEENGRHIQKVMGMLKDTFADTGAEIYPVTGNHEPDVVNMYPPVVAWDEFPLGWMYDAVIDPFAHLLPQVQLDLFRQFGYYTVVPKNFPKLRIIALNTNLCYIQNFWLPFDAIDTFGQLKWFQETLHLAEEQEEGVYILGHISPGSGSCWPVWSNQFNRIVNRYEGVIQAQFYGHSHTQHYTIAFEHGTERPISLSCMGGSSVTDGMNSGYNVYEVDGARGNDSTWEVLNQQTWIMKLTESNEKDEPIFHQILDAKKDYGVESMTPAHMYEFIYRMVCDDALFLKYQQVEVKGEDVPRLSPCKNDDKQCRGNILGDLFVSNSADHSREQMMHEFILNVNCDAIVPTTLPTTSKNPDGEENHAKSLTISVGLLLTAVMFTSI